ncbi:MAG: hypothetical protein EXR68_01770 [Dehalococcoidia bacterium]|nr:hypothetical protein [Dehalococcoidia bacterium]
MSVSTRWLVGAGIAAGVVVAIGLAVAVTGGRERTYPADTPEGTVQRYLHAIADGDVTLAMTYLGQGLRTACDEAFLRERLREPYPRDFRATLLGTRAVSDGTEVRVRISERAGAGPFDGGYEQDAFYLLLPQQDGTWRIVGSAWPVHSCPPLPARGSALSAPVAG